MSQTNMNPSAAPPVETGQNLTKIIAASSAGTLIEWYDFYIFGSLAVTISKVFFPKDLGAAALLNTLGLFAIGFVFRPFGAIVFGYLGDKIGRKYTFMVTLLLMGGSTFLIGVLPGFETIGWAAPILLIVLRLLQGLALGGEYGGAATYVAEHAPDGQRGYWTSWIQTTATLGLFISLAVILICRVQLTDVQFESWGWRIPFLISLLLVGFTYYIRRKMHESPLFQRMKSTGKSSKNPIKESFGNWVNLRLVLLALFGATAGQGVVWYTGQFYAMNFIKSTMFVNEMQAEELVSIALVLGTPFFVVFGALSDKIGRKGIMMTGCLLAVVCYYPIYTAKLALRDDYDGEVTKLSTPLEVKAPTVKEIPANAEKKTTASTETTTVTIEKYKDGTTRTLTKTVVTAEGAAPKETVKKGLKFESLTALPAMKLTLLVWIQVMFVTMAYGPIAAFLVELFPTKIRYSSMSLPYHIGNGVFGGLVPYIGLRLVTAYDNPLAGLWYPMAIAALTIVIGTLLIKENRNVKMQDEH